MGDCRLEPIFVLTRNQIFGGSLGVYFFFVISGFLISDSWLRLEDPIRFLIHRVLRIFPAYLLVCALGVLVLGPAVAYMSRADYFEGLARAPVWRIPLLGQIWLPIFEGNPFNGEWNGSLWTIRYEFLCYLLVLGCGALGLLRFPFVMLGLFLTAWAAHASFLFAPALRAAAAQEHWLFGNPAEWPAFLSFFLAGTLARTWAKRLPLSPVWFATSVVALIVASAGGFPWFPLLLPIFGTYALLFLVLSPLSWLPQRKPSNDYSYGVYLYAFPIQQTLLFLLPARLIGAPLLLFVCTVPLVLVCAALSWHLLEKPALRLKNVVRLVSATP